jgi:hypothetical protein
LKVLAALAGLATAGGGALLNSYMQQRGQRNESQQVLDQLRFKLQAGKQ